jgi:hypothetical protein
MVESALGVSLEEHDSTYYPGGIYYMSGHLGSEHFELQLNWDEAEQEYAEPKHERFPVLLRIEETERAETLRAALEASIPGITLLEDGQL